MLITDTDSPDERTALISKIVTFDKDIHKFESKIRDLQENAEDVVSETIEHKNIKALEDQLKSEREALKRRMMSNSDYNALLMIIADEKDALHQAKENMSDFLVAYFGDTKELQIELGPRMAREVLIKARLGKETQYQTSIFNQETSNG
jgi:hypothetical protein